MKKKGYYEYDQPIYPHLLCVGVGLQFEDAKKAFLNNDGTDIEEYEFGKCDGFTYYGLHVRRDGRKGSRYFLCSAINRNCCCRFCLWLLVRSNFLPHVPRYYLAQLHPHNFLLWFYLLFNFLAILSVTPALPALCVGTACADFIVTHVLVHHLLLSGQPTCQMP